LTVSIFAIDKFICHKLGYRYKKTCSPVSESASMPLLRVSNGKLGKTSRSLTGKACCLATRKSFADSARIEHHRRNNEPSAVRYRV
jgi:hypothetical protein